MFVWVSLFACGGDPGEGKDEKCIDEIPYDGVDQDCVDGDLVDVDLDGFAAVEAGGDDCDDADASISPDVAEIPYDGVDQDCADGDLIDVDLDGHAAISAGGDDCDDDNASAFPGAEDSFGNGIDESCDGLDGVDNDEDGFASVGSGGDDCDDGQSAINPDAEEIWHDGVDQNCDQQCDGDEDGDGAVSPGTPVNNNSPCDTEPGPDAYAPTDCNDQDDTVTEMFVWSSDPEDGDLGVAVVAEIRVYYSGDDPDPVLTLTDSAGAVVPGTTSLGGGTARFTPDAPLAFFSSYQLSFDHSCGSFVASFVTEDEPVPVDGASLVGRAYETDLAAGNWTQPAGVGDLLASQLGDLLGYGQFLAQGTDTFDVRFAAGSNGAQDLCVPTLDVLGADFSNNPYLSAEIPSHEFVFDEIPLPLSDVSLSARVQSDMAAIAGGTLSATLDTRTLGDAFGLGGGESAICDLIATFGVLCQSCADGNLYCMPILVEDLYMPEVSLELVARTQEDIDADTGCP